MKPQIEKQLVKRLKILGWVLVVCAAGALIYKYLPQTEDDYAALEEEIENEPPLNPFFVSAIFGLVGTSCFFISWKKKKSLFSPSSENKDLE